VVAGIQVLGPQFFRYSGMAVRGNDDELSAMPVSPLPNRLRWRVPPYSVGDLLLSISGPATYRHSLTTPSSTSASTSEER
jgi:hypothetical protein